MRTASVNSAMVSAHRRERGVTLVELMVALVMLAVGILALAQLFPLGTREQVDTQRNSSANFLAQQEIERLNGLAWTHPDLAEGSHPTSTLDHAFTRTWTVANVGGGLDGVKRIVVTVSWKNGTKTATATTYMRR